MKKMVSSCNVITSLFHKMLNNTLYIWKVFFLYLDTWSLTWISRNDSVPLSSLQGGLVQGVWNVWTCNTNQGAFWLITNVLTVEKCWLSLCLHALFAFYSAPLQRAAGPPAKLHASAASCEQGHGETSFIFFFPLTFSQWKPFIHCSYWCVFQVACLHPSIPPGLLMPYHVNRK